MRTVAASTILILSLSSSPAGALEAYDQTLILQGVTFQVQCDNAASLNTLTLTPSCGCCKKWVSHLEQRGYTVEAHNQNRNKLKSIKAEMGVPRGLQSCHTAKTGGYIIEGHVPADVIARLLKEKSQIKGLVVPDMPMGSPGMEGPRRDSYDVLALQENGKTSIFASQ